MVRAQEIKKLSFTLPAALLLLFSGVVSAQQDPPSRVARLNYINGNVSMEPAGVDDWAPAELNRPFTIGDYLYTDQGGQAELHLDVAVIRMGSQTSFGFLNLDDRTVQLKLTEGDLSVRVRHFSSDQVFEVDTPNAAVNLLRDGLYRFRVDPNGTMSFVVVREGQAEITGGGQAFTLNADNSATLTGTDQLAYDIQLAPQPDEFDQWCEQRDAHEAHLASARYLPPTMVGYEDLDDYGTWSQAPDYGPVWYPRSVAVGWAPYHYGHWAWIDPWGWTWVDSMPWGFAPFHYGRWVYVGARWGWCPGPVAVGFGGPVVRPWYAPAMVAWFGGAHWGVGISIGGGPSLGWVPLGWGEVYTPAYHCSPRYFNNVNVYNTRIVNNVNITNVYNTVYVNKTVYNQTYVNVRAPNAVMAMPQTAFASGRPVQQIARPIPAAQVAQIRQAAVVAPPVAPTRQAFLATANANRPVVRPPAQVMRQAVVARSTPPAAPAPSAARQSYLQQHASTGQPLNIQEMHQAMASARVTPNVRPAPAATPVAVRPGERGGAAVAARPNTAQPNQPRTGVSGPAETAPAAHGAPPNRQNQPAQTYQPPNQPAAANERPNQPAAANERPNQPAAPNRPQEENRQATEPQRTAPAGHGVPPNMRQSNSGQPAENERTNTNARTQPPSQAEPRTTQPARTNEPANRPAYSPGERPATRTQPAPEERPATRQQPAERPQPAERTQPVERSQPERRAYPARSPEPKEERSAPAREESRPAPKEEKSSHDHKGR